MLNLFERILMLKNSQVFSEVSTENLRVVARELVDDEYLEGERVFDIDENGDHMYIIAKGKIGISLSRDHADKNYVAILGEGDCFGEMGMLDGKPRSASAYVIENSHLLVLEKTSLLGLIARYPELALGMLRSMSLRIREANSKMQKD